MLLWCGAVLRSFLGGRQELVAAMLNLDADRRVAVADIWAFSWCQHAIAYPARAATCLPAPSLRLARCTRSRRSD